MASEKPVPLMKQRLKKGKERRTCQCIVHNEKLRNFGEVKTLTNYSWDRIQNVAQMRKVASNKSDQLLHICNAIPSEFNPSQHGYHRTCYQAFTNVKYLRKRKAEIDECEGETSGKKRSGVKGTLFPNDECIICQRKAKYIKRTREKLIKCVTEIAKLSIQEAAHRKQDTRMIGLTDTQCIIAKEAHYHDSCRREYVRSERRKSDVPSCSNGLEKAHEDAFQYISAHIETFIITGGHIERMTMIKEKYLSFMQAKYPEHYNPNYKTDKLKAKLQRHFGDKLQFWRPHYLSELVYATDIPKGLAVEAAFEAVSSDQRRIEETAMILRRVILDTYKNIEGHQYEN